MSFTLRSPYTYISKTEKEIPLNLKIPVTGMDNETACRSRTISKSIIGNRSDRYKNQI